jgi:Ca2+/H+ antiporter, TMEM165/GDT1 family
MIDWTSAAPSMLASFLASLVECVEALTIVLAVGAVRGWRSALLGTGAAFAILIALIALLGPALARIPLPTVQFAVGSLLLLFGLRWLRKAILRSAGVLSVHDESEAFKAQTALLNAHGAATRQTIDKLAFGTAFQIVMIEGIEVVFIVVAIGASSGMLVPASLGAGLALAVVGTLGWGLRSPLAKVPENALKFAVGVLLSAFGSFWAGEGIGLEWPGSDWAVLALIAAYLLLAIGLVQLCKRVRRVDPGNAAPATAVIKSREHPAALFVKELLGLFVDDGLLAAGIVTWILAARWIEAGYPPAALPGSIAFFAGISAILAASAIRRAKNC